jgi:hypothetical protein
MTFDVTGAMIEHTLDGVSQPLLIASQQPRLKAVSGPGNVFSFVIRRITGVLPCGCCREHIAQMNQWGWLKCWRNRKMIAGWLREEAAKRGHVITDRVAMDLLVAAWREYRQNRSPRSN